MNSVVSHKKLSKLLNTMNASCRVLTSILTSKLNVRSSDIKRSLCSGYNFVPKHVPSSADDVRKLQKFVDDHAKLLVLTGAGISTESGIPDYRSEGVGLYSRSKTRPVQFKDFVSNERIRRRYWARNYLGWPRFSSVQPNATHFCLAKWEKSGKIRCVVTQNVDRLHHKAGTENLIELHGSSYTVKCMSCSYYTPRIAFQQELKYLNPSIDIEVHELRPDGDVDIESEIVANFKVPACKRCQGILKPDIVFFGDNVPKDRVDRVFSELNQSDALLVLGSSLQVYSGYRFVLAAIDDQKPVLIVNIGPTRADHLPIVKIENRCGELLPAIRIA